MRATMSIARRSTSERTACYPARARNARLPRGHWLRLGVRPAGRPLWPEAAVVPQADRPSNDGDRLLLAARGWADGDIHRHGAGAAELHRLRPLLGRKRH